MNKAILVAAAVIGALLAAITLLRRDSGGGGAPLAGEGVVNEQPFDSMTRDELYELARQRDIPGRSRMKKHELRAALRGA
jgi:hypothetical protein